MKKRIFVTVLLFMVLSICNKPSDASANFIYKYNTLL